MVKNCLKSTLVAEISRIKVTKKSDLFTLPFVLFRSGRMLKFVSMTDI